MEPSQIDLTEKGKTKLISGYFWLEYQPTVQKSTVLYKLSCGIDRGQIIQQYCVSYKKNGSSLTLEVSPARFSVLHI